MNVTVCINKAGKRDRNFQTFAKFLFSWQWEIYDFLYGFWNFSGEINFFWIACCVIIISSLLFITLSSGKNRLLTTSIVSIFGFFFQFGRRPLTCKKLTIVLTECCSFCHVLCDWKRLRKHRKHSRMCVDYEFLYLEIISSKNKTNYDTT